MSGFAKIKSQKQNREHTIGIRFTSEEYEVVKEKVAGYGGSMSDYLRRVALGRNVTQIPSSELLILISENVYISNDLKNSLTELYGLISENDSAKRCLEKSRALAENLENNYKLIIKALQ